MLDDESAIFNPETLPSPLSPPPTRNFQRPESETSVDEIEEMLKKQLFQESKEELKKETRRKKLAKLQACLGEVCLSPPSNPPLRPYLVL